MPSISVLILTKNEEQDLPGCLSSVSWCDDVHVFDSFSSDATVDLARAAGAKVTQRRFDNWAAHQNWGLAHLPFKHPWVLYLDADERVSDSLCQTLAAEDWPATGKAAFEIRRRDFAWDGTWLRHAQISPYYLRLFQPGKMHYRRLVNPVSIVDGEIGRLAGFLDHYPFSKGFRYWIERHLNYADLEAEIIETENGNSGEAGSFAKALFSHDFTQRRKNQKQLFYRLPFRPLIKFLYMLLGRRAFLDGRAGVTYALLQSVYEYFIVLRQRELRKAHQGVFFKKPNRVGQQPRALRRQDHQSGSTTMKMRHITKLSTCLVLFLAVGAFDYLTGYEVSSYPMYLMPIFLSFFYFGRKGGYLASLIAIGMWYGIDIADKHFYTFEVIRVWNALSRLLVYLLFVHGLSIYVKTVAGHQQRLENLRRMIAMCHGCGRVLWKDGAWKTPKETRDLVDAEVPECPACALSDARSRA